MRQKKPKVKVIWEYIDSEESKERLLRVFDMLLKDIPPDSDPGSKTSA